MCRRAAPHPVSGRGGGWNRSATAPTRSGWSAPTRPGANMRCGRCESNRRATVCPSCADLYARDTWQLVHAGAAGGHHDVPAEVADRPQVFATLTAPGYGAVHNATGTTCHARTPRVTTQHCRHGNPLHCNTSHAVDDPVVGQPLCADCYDYLGHVLFTWHLPELWRRLTIALRRAITAHLKAIGFSTDSVRVSFVKVVELQVRAIPHIHALIRLDPPGDRPTASGDHISDGPAAPREWWEPRSRVGQDAGRSRCPITATELTALIRKPPIASASRDTRRRRDPRRDGVRTLAVRHPNRHSSIGIRNRHGCTRSPPYRGPITGASSRLSPPGRRPGSEIRHQIVARLRDHRATPVRRSDHRLGCQ
ncbi:replication initiator [Mycobacterium kiyosense]